MKTAILAFAFAMMGCSSTETTTEAPGDAELPEQERVTVAAPSGPAAAAPIERYVLPAWSREDVQPRSARFGARYGLEAYEGKTLVVVLLEGHCPYCQSNSVVAQRLQTTLDAEALDAQIVILGDLNAERFGDKVDLPIFRDDDGNAWDEMRPGASKHDTFVFGPDGKRTYFWPGSYQGDATRWTADIGAAVRAVARPRASTP